MTWFDHDGVLQARGQLSGEGAWEFVCQIMKAGDSVVITDEEGLRWTLKKYRTVRGLHLQMFVEGRRLSVPLGAGRRVLVGS